MCGKRSLFPQPHKEELNDLLPIHFFSLLLTLMPTHDFLATYRSCATFQVSDSQAMRLGLQESCTVTLLSLGMVPAWTRSPSWRLRRKDLSLGSPKAHTPWPLCEDINYSHLPAVACLSTDSSSFSSDSRSLMSSFYWLQSMACRGGHEQTPRDGDSPAAFSTCYPDIWKQKPAFKVVTL